jgi:hypothetical protein
MANRTDDTAFGILMRNSEYTRDRVDEMIKVTQNLLQDTTKATLRLIQIDKEIEKLQQDLSGYVELRQDILNMKKIRDINIRRWKWAGSILGPIILIGMYNTITRLMFTVIQWYITQ